jgi:hypothetical protein
VIILTTSFTGGVILTIPTDEAMGFMTQGGGWWDGRPRGFVEEQIERNIRDGRDPRGAHRFVKAMGEGGCTTAEALEIIRDRDAAHLGTAHEVVTREDIPGDRWFRDAWRRSHNGGPVYIDLEMARKVHLKRLTFFADRHRLKLNLPRWRHRIRTAPSLEALRMEWPKARAA